MKHTSGEKDLTVPAQGRSRAYTCNTRDFGSSLSQCPWRREWQVPRTSLNQINASRIWLSGRDESWPECSHCGSKLSLCKAGYGNAPHCAVHSICSLWALAIPTGLRSGQTITPKENVSSYFCRMLLKAMADDTEAFPVSLVNSG